MTSRCHRNGQTGSMQSLNMAAISITALISFFSYEPSLIQRGKNHCKPGHIDLVKYSSN